MSRGYASHSKGHIFNKVDDSLNRHQDDEICQNLMWLENDWLIAHVRRVIVMNQSGMTQSCAKLVW